MPFFCILKGLSRKYKIIFHVIDSLNDRSTKTWTRKIMQYCCSVCLILKQKTTGYYGLSVDKPRGMLGEQEDNS